MHKTLLVMAAGMGSRYGGLKQIDSVGPNGEYLIDYSVYDAVRAGFDKIVFVIREDFAPQFRAHFEQYPLPDHVTLEYVYQRLDDLPAGYTAPAERQKPWGTGHAVWSARDAINEPMAVISADDFYGREAFVTVSNWLENLPAVSHDHYAVVGYRLGNTLSPNGWVARGLLKMDESHHLTSIHEHTKIGWVNGQIVSRDKANVDHILPADRLVSMVLFAFTPDFFAHLETSFCRFLDEHLTDLTCEFFTPNVVNDLIQASTSQMEVIPTTSNWFGVTYASDKQVTIDAIARLIGENVYPRHLWT